MPRSSAAAISAPSASGVIIVPLGLAGLATSTPASGASAWARSSISGVSTWRVAASVSISTGDQAEGA